MSPWTWYLDIWDPWRAADGLPLPLPHGWATRVRTMSRAGIRDEEWRDIVRKAMGAPHVSLNSVFAYTIGIAWGYLADRDMDGCGTGAYLDREMTA